jgi:hypothetical protein
MPWPQFPDSPGALDQLLLLDRQLSAGILPTTVDPGTPSATNWWDADFNTLADRVLLPTFGFIYTWSEHAVVRMFERDIRVDQVVTSLHERHRGSRDPWWIKIEYGGSCCHTGANGVKVWISFSEGVHCIKTVMYSGFPDVGSAVSYVPTSFEKKMNTVIARSKNITSVLAAAGVIAAGDLAFRDSARPQGGSRKRHAEDTVPPWHEEPDRTQPCYVFRPEHQRVPLVAASWEIAKDFLRKNPEWSAPQVCTTINGAVDYLKAYFPDTMANSRYILAV